MIIVIMMVIMVIVVMVITMPVWIVSMRVSLAIFNGTA
jgi:hypothetical protein